MSFISFQTPKCSFLCQQVPLMSQVNYWFKVAIYSIEYEQINTISPILTSVQEKNCSHSLKQKYNFLPVSIIYS